MTERKLFDSLNRKGDFKKTFDLGYKFSSKHLVIYALPNGLSFNRLGLAVGKKIGTAVARNRVKRLLREAIRKQPIQTSLRYDIVIVARKAINEAGFAEVYRDVSEFFSRVANEDIDNKLDKVL